MLAYWSLKNAMHMSDGSVSKNIQPLFFIKQPTPVVSSQQSKVQHPMIPFEHAVLRIF